MVWQAPLHVLFPIHVQGAPKNSEEILNVSFSRLILIPLLPLVRKMTSGTWFNVLGFPFCNLYNDYQIVIKICKD